MTKLSRSIFFVSFREKIKSGYDVEIVISNFFTALYFDTGPSPHSVQIIIHLRFYLSTNNRLPFQKPPKGLIRTAKRVKQADLQKSVLIPFFLPVADL